MFLHKEDPKNGSVAPENRGGSAAVRRTDNKFYELTPFYKCNNILHYMTHILKKIEEDKQYLYFLCQVSARTQMRRVIDVFEW
jgi:hypothetical protein